MALVALIALMALMALMTLMTLMTIMTMTDPQLQDVKNSTWITFYPPLKMTQISAFVSTLSLLAESNLSATISEEVQVIRCPRFTIFFA